MRFKLCFKLRFSCVVCFCFVPFHFFNFCCCCCCKTPVISHLSLIKWSTFMQLFNKCGQLWLKNKLWLLQFAVILENIQKMSICQFLIVKSSLVIVYLSADKYLYLINRLRCHDQLINKQISIIVKLKT